MYTVLRSLSKEINLLGVGLTIVVLASLSLIIDIQTLKEWVAKAGVFAPLVFMLLKISTIVVAPISGGPLYPIAGLFFGFWHGLLYVCIADFVGFSIAFCISRFFGQRLVLRCIAQNEKGVLAKIINQIGNARGFFRTTLAFLPLPEILSYGAGLSALPYRVFIAILWPIWTIVSLIFVSIGAFVDFGDGSLIASLGVSGLAGLFLLGGALFFAKGIKSGVQP